MNTQDPAGITHARRVPFFATMVRATTVREWVQLLTFCSLHSGNEGEKQFLHVFLPVTLTKFG